MAIYTVRSGDTLNKIAKNYGVSPADIAKANGLQNQDLILVGQPLVIPNTGLRSYVVQAGDTLWKIIQRFGLSLQQVLELNPHELPNPNLLEVGQRLQLPGAKQEIVVNGYCYPTVRDEILDESLPQLTFLSVFACAVGADGTLSEMNNDARVIQKAKLAGVRPHMVIANIEQGKGFQSETAKAFLQSTAAQDRLLESCVRLMKQKGYTGLDVDLEYVPTSVKENLVSFLAKAKAWMHDEGFLLSSALPPKTSDTQGGLLYEGFDFSGEGKYNDFVTLMTYEWGYQGGPPMAVAPVPEVKQALEYAVSRMPKSKILMGIPNYGYDWKLPYQAGTNATVVQNIGAPAIAARNSVGIRYDEKAQAPWFRYTEAGGQLHEVWFENAKSIAAKFSLVQELGLGGVSYWTVNHSFPQNWALLHNMFRVKKM